METVSKPIRIKNESFKKFQKLCEEEGRKQGKMLEILVDEFLKRKNIEKNNED